MSQKPLHERFTREQVLYALDTTHEDCKHGCPHGPTLDDVTVLPAVVRSLLHISDLAIKEGISTEMIAFSEGLHFGLRLAEIENKTFPPDENLAGKTSHQRAEEVAGTERITRDPFFEPHRSEPDFTLAKTPFYREEPIRLVSSTLESTGTDGN